MIRRVFRSQTKTVTLAALILGASALISRLLGLLRDRLLAGTFGAGPELDVYFAAFRIPDFIYGILIMGGISAIFLPVFSEYFKKGEEDGWRLASNVLNVFLVLLILLCSVLAVFTPWLIKLVAPGFNSEQASVAVSLTRIIFLSPIFLGLSSLFSGVLHYFNRFLAYSLAPIVYNLSIIFGILVFVPLFGIHGLAFGVVLGAFLHWIVQVPAAISSGFRYFPSFNFKSPGLKKVFRLMLPRMVGASVYHINLVVVTAIASTLTVGSIAIFNFANNIQHMPIGIVGASFALASFPALSRAWAQDKKKEFLDGFSSAFRQIIFLVVPISVFLFLLRAQVIRLVLGTGEFGWIETRLTAASLGVFCLSIFAFALIPFLLRAFFSLHDTKTPAFISLAYMIFNTLFAFLLVRVLSYSNAFQEFFIKALKLQGISDISVVGLSLAVSLSGLIYFSLLLFFLRKKLDHIRLKEIRNSFTKIVLSAGFMAVAVYLVLQTSVFFLKTETFAGIFFQTFLAGLVAILAFFLFSLVFKSSEAQATKSLILKKFNKQ
ncbi:MAG: murein biosynthesis integral membrane protein MurJ [Candidatus Nealsonbacteria bacterium]